MPALRALRAARPTEPLALAAQPRLARLLAALGLVDEAVDFESLHLAALFEGEQIGLGEAEPLTTYLRPRSMQAGHTVSAPIIAWFGARDPGFVARLTALAPGAIVAPPWVRGRPVWEHLLETVGVSAAHAEPFRAPIAVPPGLAAAGARALADAGPESGRPVVLVHPGAGGLAKRWPAAGFAGVLECLVSARRVEVIVHEGPADRAAVEDLARRLRVPLRRLHEPPLPALAGVLVGAAAYVGNDSGVSQLASAVGTPGVTLFTRDALEWRPWAPGAEPLVVGTRTLEAGDVERVTAALLALVPSSAEKEG